MWQVYMLNLGCVYLEDCPIPSYSFMFEITRGKKKVQCSDVIGGQQILSFVQTSFSRAFSELRWVRFPWAVPRMGSHPPSLSVFCEVHTAGPG